MRIDLNKQIRLVKSGLILVFALLSATMSRALAPDIYEVDDTPAQARLLAVGDAFQGSPALGVDGTIYLGSLAGNFHAFDPSGGYTPVPLTIMFE